MQAITKDQLENLEIILPPIEIQNKFEVNWSKIYKMIKNTKSLKSDLLFDSLLQQAFKGELVKQQHHDQSLYITNKRTQT